MKYLIPSLLFIVISLSSYSQSKRELRLTISMLVGQKDSLKDIINEHKLMNDSLKAELNQLQRINDLLRDSLSFAHFSKEKSSNKTKNVATDNQSDSIGINDSFFVQKNFDKFKERTFISDSRSSTYCRNGNAGAYLHPYFSIRNNGSKSNSFMARMQYKANDWLFIEKIILLVDGKQYEFKGDVKQDNSSSTIYEWIDVPISKELLQKIISSNHKGQEIDIRFVGDVYSKDFTLNDWQIKGIKNLLDLYNSK